MLTSTPPPAICSGCGSASKPIIHTDPRGWTWCAECRHEAWTTADWFICSGCHRAEEGPGHTVDAETYCDDCAAQLCSMAARQDWAEREAEWRADR